MIHDTKDGATTTTTAPSRVQLLNLLSSYIDAHSYASAALKDTFWNISKSRRQKSNNEISALNVRDTLYSRVCLEWTPTSHHHDEPDLKEEEDDDDDDDDDGRTAKEDGGILTLYLDGMTAILPTTTTTTNTEIGLRQRRNNNAAATIIDNKDWIEQDVDKELQKTVNPLDLFGGLIPPALKMAQTNAKTSLEHYVDAANLAIEIGRLCRLLELSDEGMNE